VKKENTYHTQDQRVTNAQTVSRYFMIDQVGWGLRRRRGRKSCKEDT